jgi:hypothetical protein
MCIHRYFTVCTPSCANKILPNPLFQKRMQFQMRLTFHPIHASYSSPHSRRVVVILVLCCVIPALSSCFRLHPRWPGWQAGRELGAKASGNTERESQWRGIERPVARRGSGPYHHGTWNIASFHILETSFAKQETRIYCGTPFQIHSRNTAQPRSKVRSGQTKPEI